MKAFPKIGIYALVMFIHVTGYGQLERMHISPSPNASYAIGATNVNMSYYTGVANISIPLHSVTGKDIVIPISLDYQTTGIKVDDVSSSVGTGWSLNANTFAITRVVRGLPDGSKRNCNTDGSGKIARNEIYNTNYEFCDAERDIFYFSLPSKSGKFFLDDSGQPQTMPYQDILISPGVGSQSIGFWKIIDEFGYTYYFGEDSNSKEETQYSVSVNNVETTKDPFISTWYLKRIVSPKGAQVATFSYTAGSNVAYKKRGARILGCATNPTATEITTNIQINSPKYISTITTDIASCIFSYDNNRQDLAGALRLATVSFNDHSNNVMKRYHLEGSCFEDYRGGTWSQCTRLKLQSIKEGVSTPVTTHSFVYDEDPLPPIGSYYTDHYGYFNLGSGDFNLASGGGMGYKESSVPTVSSVCNNGRLKVSNGYALSAILTEIHSAIGGRTVFEYINAVGARLKSISNFNGEELVAKSVFSYSAAETYKTPVYHYYNIENSNSLIRSSNAYNSVFDLNGVAIGYGTVVETLLDGSKIERKFYNFSDNSDTPPIVGRYQGNNPSSFIASSDANSSPFAPSTSRAWLRGLPKSIRIIDNFNNTLSKQEFFYFGSSPLSTVWNMAVELYNNTPGSQKYYVGDYALRSEHVYLSYQYNYVYDQTDFTRYRNETTVYSYHDKHKTFPKSIQMNYGSHSKKVTFKYPIDLIGNGTEAANASETAAGIWALSKSHVITAVEKLEYRWDESSSSGAEKLIGGELYTYRKNLLTGSPLLKGIYSLNRASAEDGFTSTVLSSDMSTLDIDNNFQLMQTFEYNDNTAGSNVNLTSTTDNKGITRNYEYGYNNTLVTSEYSMLGSAKVGDQYTYNTVFGLLSQSDANNQSIRYEYDNLGRLKLIKDKGGNILKRYRYNYANVNEFGVNFTVSNTTATTGQTISFSASGTDNVGVTRYVWDFGDGQVAEGTSTTVSHVYSSVGTFTVKLFKINPEYGTISQTKTVIINQAPSVSINASTTYVNLCEGGGSLVLNASGGGGCSALTYVWYANKNEGAWSTIGGGPSISYYPNGPGSYSLMCEVRDSCGNRAESYSVTISVVKTPSNCPEP